MKKVLLLMVALISLAVMGCSDSDDKFQAGIVGYESFVAAKNTWKEPTSYSYTVKVDARIASYYMIDVKVVNGTASYSINPSQEDLKESLDKECSRIKEMGWNITTIKDLLESMNNNAVAAYYRMGHHVVYTDWDYKTPADLIAYNNYIRGLSESENYYILIKYGDINKLNIPISFCSVKPEKDGYVGGGGTHTISISNFKILEE